MQPPNFLDVMIMRFRDRWETDRQYRAAMSGVLGLITIIVLCSCTGIVSATASSALASAGFGSGYGPDGTPVTGVDSLHAPPVFPTDTVPPWTPGTLPAAPPVPNSQTPIPVPTATPAPTFVDTTPSAAPGGSLPTTCNGGSGNAKWALTPCPQRAGQAGTLSISDPSYKGAPLNVLINFGICSGNASCTYLFTPQQGYALDSNGSATISYTVPAAAANNTAPIGGYINIGNPGPTLTINAAPVQ
jgi:hypothetical protein